MLQVILTWTYGDNTRVIYTCKLQNIELPRSYIYCDWTDNDNMCTLKQVHSSHQCIHWIHLQIQALQVFCHLHSSLWLWNMDPAYWLWKKGSKLVSKPSAWENFSASLTSSTRPSTWCGARSTSLWVHRNLVQACHMPQQSLQNHPSGHIGGGWRCGWQRKCWMDNIKVRTPLPMPDLLTRASCRKDWKQISAELSLMSP